MSNFWKRAITGTIFVALVLLSVFFAQFLLAPLFCVFACIGIKEYANIVKTKNIETNYLLTILFTISLFLLFFINTLTFSSIVLTLLSAISSIFLLLIPITAIHSKKFSSFTSLIHTFTPLIWVTAPLFLLTAWGTLLDSSIVLALILLVWASDTFAYCFGVLFGKHKLHPRISPKKSWEGFILSAITTTLLSTLFATSSYFSSPIFESAFHWWGFAIVVIVCSLYGDLVESLFKRNFEVKDSGKILPGHGGILDRFDSFFIAVPAAFVYYLICTLL